MEAVSDPFTCEILIVEDDPRWRQLMQRALAARYRVRTAEDGLKGLLEAVTGEPPDLIVADVTMPTLDGFAMAKRLRQNAHTQNVPIMFLTANTSPQDVSSGIQLGASFYLAKPFDEGTLLQKVDQVIEQERMFRRGR
jgi:DNA-binding response OmpR family regulator